MKTSYFTYLRIFWDILYKIIFLVLQKYYFIQYVPKYHQKLGCQANGGALFCRKWGAHILFSGKKCMKLKEIGLKN